MQYRPERHACNRHCVGDSGRNWTGGASRKCGLPSVTPCMGRASAFRLPSPVEKPSAAGGARCRGVQHTLQPARGIVRATTLGAWGSFRFVQLEPLGLALALAPALCRAMAGIVGRIRHGRQFAASMGEFMTEHSASQSGPSHLVVGGGHGGAALGVYLRALLPCRWGEQRCMWRMMILWCVIPHPGRCSNPAYGPFFASAVQPCMHRSSSASPFAVAPGLVRAGRPLNLCSNAVPGCATGACWGKVGHSACTATSVEGAKGSSRASDPLKHCGLADRL